MVVDIFRSLGPLADQLQHAQIDPALFGPMEPERPQLQHQKVSWMDFVAPVVEAIASYENPRRERRNTWLSPALQGLARGYTGYRQRGARDIAEANAAELARARDTNQSRARTREAFMSTLRSRTVDGKLMSPAEIEQGKTETAAGRAKATAAARVEGTNEARAAVGVPPVGTPAPKKAKAAPKPKEQSLTEKRRMLVAGIIADLSRKGMGDKYGVQSYIGQKGVVDTLAAHGLTPADLLRAVPE